MPRSQSGPKGTGKKDKLANVEECLLYKSQKYPPHLVSKNVHELNERIHINPTHKIILILDYPNCLTMLDFTSIINIIKYRLLLYY